MDKSAFATVRLSGSRNSTTFTTCCGVAIGEEDACPRCGIDIQPKGRNARFYAAYGPSKGLSYFLKHDEEYQARLRARPQSEPPA